MGAMLKVDDNLKISMIELKEKIEQLFNLSNDDKDITFLLDRFIKESA